MQLAIRSARPTAVIALALAAASTGVVIPVLRPLVAHSGHGSLAAGAFSAAHVLGGAIGAALGARALRRAGSARRLAAAALIASIAATVAMTPLPSIALLLALRLADGACHLLAITALVAAATAGDPDQRARRAVLMGIAIVLGVAGGLGVGTRFVQPGAALAMAALLSAGALVSALIGLAGLPGHAGLPGLAAGTSSTPARRPGDRGPIAPGLLAFCERFSFGGMTVAMPFLASGARVGLVLGVFLVASVVALAAAWRYAPRLGPRRLAVRSALGFTLALAAAGAVDVLASPGLAILWAVAAGAAAGSLYASALVLATGSARIEERARGMATVHAAGSAGHALGALSAGVLGLALPGLLVIALPGVAIIAAAAIGVWFIVPAAASDCPVLARLDPASPAPAPAGTPLDP